MSATYKLVTGFPNYRVGDDGTVWSCFSGRWKQMKPKAKKKGYLRVSIGGKSGQARPIHVLVLEEFVGPRPRGHESCHNDGNKENNRLSNLRWDTPENNKADKWIHGTIPHGSKVVTSKLTERDVEIVLRLLEAGVAQFRIAHGFQVSDVTISLIANKKQWRRVSEDGFLAFRESQARNR